MYLTITNNTQEDLTPGRDCRLSTIHFCNIMLELIEELKEEFETEVLGVTS
jgi:hypothetical protein